MTRVALLVAKKGDKRWASQKFVDWLPQVVLPEELKEMLAVHRRSGRDGALLLLDPEVVVVGGNDEF